MDISISEIPNNLPAARKQYKRLLEYEKKLDKLFSMLHRFLEEGKRGEVTDENLVDQWKRTDKATRSMLAEKKALEEKIKELQHDTTLQSETNKKNVHFEMNPLTLIATQPPATKIPTRSTSFPVVVQLQEAQILQPFKPTAKRIVECIQTVSGGNEEKYSLHVSSMTGAPHVSLNLSLSTASGLDHSCSFTKIRDPQELDVFPPVEQGSGMILVMTTFSTTRWKSLSVSVFTLPPSASQSILPTSPTSLTEDALNGESSLGSALLSLGGIFTMQTRGQGLMRRVVLPEMKMSKLTLINGPAESLTSRIATAFPALLPEDVTTRLLICVQVQPSMVSAPLSPRKTFESVQLNDHQLTPMLAPALKTRYMLSQPRKLTWKLPMLNTLASSPLPAAYKPLQLAKILPPAAPTGEIQLAQVQCYQSSCGAVEDGFAIQTSPSIDPYRDRLGGSFLVWLKAEHDLFDEQLNNSNVESKPSPHNSHPSPDSSKREKVEIFETPKVADIQDNLVFKSVSFTKDSVKAGAINLNAEDDRFYEILNDYLLENKPQKQQDVAVVLVPSEKDIIHLSDEKDESHFTEIDLSDDENSTIRPDPEDIFEAGYSESECLIKRKKKKRRSICRRIFSLFFSCICME